VSAPRTAVITGVTSGIGQAVTAQLLAAGTEVIGLGRDAAALARSAASLGPGFFPIEVDLGISAQRQRAVDALRAMDRPVDVYISNAAECLYESPLTVTAEQLERLFVVNVVAAIQLAQAIAPLMRKGGQVVQISSVTTRHLPGPRFASYAASKLAVEGLTEALRMELQPRGIRVAVVSPGLVDTALYQKVPGFERAQAKIAEALPMARWLRADDVATAIRWVIDQPAHVAVSELVILPAGQVR
jgi:NADP-dependent 3-hydroxy acid dehydrogenase YdfG